MKNFIKKVFYLLAIFSISVFIIDGLIFKFYYSIHKRTKVDIYNNSSDVVFFGSSRCVNTVIPEIFSNETGLSSFNMGWASSSLREVYAGVKIYLLRNQTPKYIYVQIDKNSLDTGISKLASQSLLKFFKRGIVNEYFTDELTSKLSIPLYASIFYRDFGWREMLKTFIRNENSSFLNQGYAKVNGTMNTNDLNIQKFKFFPSEYIRNKWLKEIVSICEQKKIKLVLFTAPYFNCSNSIDTMRVIKYPGFKFINLSDLLVNPKMFKDSDHVNDFGANEFSRKLGELSKAIL